MTITSTRSSTFTTTDARYVTSKMGADLRNLNTRYGSPLLAGINDYVEEAALWLRAGYLDTVDYGFKRGDRWLLRLRYMASAGGQLRDETPGRLPSATDIAGASFHSYLRHNATYDALTSEQRRAFAASLPFTRTGAAEPSTGLGSYGNSAQYSRNGAGLDRSVFVAA